MIRRPPRSTLFPLHDALPISSIGEENLEEARAAFRHASAIEPGNATARRLYAMALLDSGQFQEAIKEAQTALALENTPANREDRKSTRLNSSHANISYAVFCL